jgi:hypothetical protein
MDQNEDNVSLYHLQVLRKMLSVLPEVIGKPISEQLDEFINTFAMQEKTFRDHISKELQDVQVMLAAMQFDLISTKKERDYYKAKAEQNGHS